MVEVDPFELILTLSLPTAAPPPNLEAAGHGPRGVALADAVEIQQV
jgi:hypothetical protein